MIRKQNISRGCCSLPQINILIFINFGYIKPDRKKDLLYGILLKFLQELIFNLTTKTEVQYES